MSPLSIHPAVAPQMHGIRSRILNNEQIAILRKAVTMYIGSLYQQNSDNRIDDNELHEKLHIIDEIVDEHHQRQHHYDKPNPI